MVRLDKDLEGFIKIYEGFKKIAEKDTQTHESKVSHLTQQLKLSYKKISLINTDIWMASDKALKTAQKHKASLKKMIVEERLRSEGFWKMLITSLKYWIKQLLKRS